MHIIEVEIYHCLNIYIYFNNVFNILLEYIKKHIKIIYLLIYFMCIQEQIPTPSVEEDPSLQVPNLF